ncbi:MAG: biotin transporter BioY [Candidatus Krumholzibacteriia bacterium]
MTNATETALRGVAVAAPDTGRRLLTGLLGALLFAGLTFVGANIRIPLQPVPITLQTLFVLLAGAFLGPRAGSLGQWFYVGFGALGLPVFAGSAAGWAVISGPTGGYLLGFLVAPVVVGRLVGRRTALWWPPLVFWLGSLTILSLGVAHLTVFYTHDLSRSLSVGYVPFVAGDLLKIVAASSIYRSYNALRHRRPRG